MNPLFDGGDISNSGHWYGAEIGCLECRETSNMDLAATPKYLTNALCCSECGAELAEVEI